MSAPNGDWNEQDEQVIAMLERLGQAGASRNPALEFDGRQRFLEEAARIAANSDQPRAASVSLAGKARHIEWNIFKIFKKENMRMSTLVTILVVVTLALSGTGATVYAAQSSLPGDALYGVKVAGEAVESGITLREQPRLELALRQADERVQEMAGLANGGREIPGSLGERWQVHMERALSLSAGLRDTEMDGALVQVREHLRAQEQVALGLAEQDMARERMQAMIRERLEQVEEGLVDPQGFRARHQHGGQNSGGSPWTTGTPTPGSGYGPGPGECADCTPEGGRGPWITGTPTPGSGYGPGPGECADCTPEGGHGPWVTGTPTPGSSYGPGPGHEAEHTPVSPGPGPGTGEGPGEGGPQNGPGDGAGDGSGSGGSDNGGDDGGAGSGGGEHHEEPGDGDGNHGGGGHK